MPSEEMTRGDYIALVLLLATALVGTALFVSWAYEQRGMLAPGTTPRPGGLDAEDKRDGG